MHFGRGLVETSEDFGSQGSIPTHPGAARLAGGDVRRVRLGRQGAAQADRDVGDVSGRARTSATTLLKKDPRNVLLARFTRVRMPAEMVRDSALAASGLLVKTVGGPSVYPYQPPTHLGRLRRLHLSGRGQGAGRRASPPHAVHVHQAQRAAPGAGDLRHARSRHQRRCARQTSNTPLQALVLLDDPQYLEAYRALAAHVLTRRPTPDAQVTTVFRLATRRPPRAERNDACCARIYDAQLQRYASDRTRPPQLLRIGVDARCRGARSRAAGGADERDGRRS